MQMILQAVSSTIDPRDIRDFSIIASMVVTGMLPDAAFFVVYRTFAVLVGGMVFLGIVTGS